jgi:hypothetical protein
MSETDLVVGCPVAHREWILDAWFDHVEEACEVAGVKPGYAFAGDCTDETMMKIIFSRAPSDHLVVLDVPNSRGADVRDWASPGRYAHMVEIRNLLLEGVRMMDAGLFLSLDSDILIHPFAIRNLIDDVTEDGWGAVGGKCYMTSTGTRYPSWGKLGREGQIMRTDADGYFAVEVIMAIKMMTPAAYRVDYRLDLQGEDIGWSRACREAGLSLAWDGRVASKHVLEPHLLDRIDPRVGY